MKKRIGALILALALCLPLVTVSAADTVYFTSMNDSLMGLSDSTMPYWSGGYLYVPASSFNGRDINVYYSRSADKQTLILYSGKRALSFDLGQDETYDSYGNIYAERAQLRGGTPYVPVARWPPFSTSPIPTPRWITATWSASGTITPCWMTGSSLRPPGR